MDEIRRLQDRLRTLSGALRAFAEATTDYERLLDVVAKTLADVVQDGCVVRLLSEGGWLSPVAIHLPFESCVEDANACARTRAHVAAPRNVGEQSSARRVIETGEPVLIPKVDLSELRSSATPEIVQAYETIGIHSLLLVPLRVRGESIGLLSLVRFTPESPPFDEHDLELAQALADHAALALTNARLLSSARRELEERERAEAALKKTEEQLVQAQKMEAVGRLAGGVAHDFNNLLSAILGYSAILLEDLEAGDRVREEIEEIKKAGERAATLTRQLLAFSRQQVLEPRIVDLNEVIGNIDQMLRRLLGEDVTLLVSTHRELSKIKVDPGQIEHVIMNLVVNARDAMPNGGRLTIETHNVILDEAYAREHPEVTPGPHVLLAVSDSGIGMDKKTLGRIFEPFFTTKVKGKGTGLGLSMVFGIVTQSRGSIWVYSEPGKGATFKIYFPASFERGVTHSSSDLLVASTRGSETILLVEDDDLVRAVARRVLRREGYRIIEARNATEALAASEEHGGVIHLLLSDVVMPEMSGPRLAEQLTMKRPQLKVLYMSGYTDDAIVHHGVLELGAAFLQKPITVETLSRKVREILDHCEARIPNW
jgi:signal transduction histidine kinase/ActR/RegA family two-component response regulator